MKVVGMALSSLPGMSLGLLNVLLLPLLFGFVGFFDSR